MDSGARNRCLGPLWGRHDVMATDKEPQEPADVTEVGRRGWGMFAGIHR